MTTPAPPPSPSPVVPVGSRDVTAPLPAVPASVAPARPSGPAPTPCRASAATAVAIVALGVAFVMAVVVTVVWLAVGRPPKSDVEPLIPPDHCLAVAADYRGVMTPEQGGNAAIIVGESIRRGLPARAATIALVTAWQESGLRNLDYGDRDSLGLFQQRPSQGWGTADQIMDPWYSAGKFYDELVKVANWQTEDIGSVAQAVQRSAYPDAYAPHEGAGRAWASTLTGQTPAGVRCIANDGPGGGGDELVGLLTRIWGGTIAIDRSDRTITITAPSAAVAWAVAQLSQAQLEAYGLTSIQVGGKLWTHDARALAVWQDLAATPPTPSVSSSAPVSPTAAPPAISDATVVVTLR